jgi:hypothetical protein
VAISLHMRKANSPGLLYFSAHSFTVRYLHTVRKMSAQC